MVLWQFVFTWHQNQFDVEHNFSMSLSSSSILLLGIILCGVGTGIAIFVIPPLFTNIIYHNLIIM